MNHAKERKETSLEKNLYKVVLFSKQSKLLSLLILNAPIFKLGAIPVHM